MRILRISFLALCLTSLIGLYALSRPLSDFVEYWTAAHLFVAHKNPYSLTQTLQSQQVLGWQKPVPLMLLNPPWILPLIAPLGLAESYPLAWLVWVGASAGILALSSLLLVNLYSNNGIPGIAGSSTSRGLLALTFYPALVCLKFAQVGPLLLLGVVGFLWFESRGRPFLAGISLALTAIKPQLVYLVLLAVVVRCLQQRCWKLLVSAAGVVGLLTMIAVFVDHRVMREYWVLSSGPYVQLFPSGVGAILRLPFGSRDTFWLQFVPPIAGLVWFVVYWRQHQRNWDWAERMPFVVTASVLTTAYGWVFDQVLLVVPIVALAARYSKNYGGVPRKVTLVYTLLNIVLVIALTRGSPFAFLLAPITVGLFESWTPAATSETEQMATI